MKGFVLFFTILNLSACESDKTKYERIQTTRLAYCHEPAVDVEVATTIYKSRGHSEPPPATLIDSVGTANGTKCALATRDLNKFMNH